MGADGDRRVGVVEVVADARRPSRGGCGGLGRAGGPCGEGRRSLVYAPIVVRRALVRDALARAFVVLAASGCADDDAVAGGFDDSGTSAEPVECPVLDGVQTASLYVGPCADVACTELDAAAWWPTPNGTEPVSLEVELTCAVAIDPPSQDDRWHLVECTGSGAPEHGVLVRLAGALGSGFELEPGAELRISYAAGSDGLYAEWTFVALRSAVGDVLALSSIGDAMPSDAFTSPLRLQGGAVDCAGKASACGGTVYPGEVYVNTGDDEAWIPRTRSELVGVAPQYAVAVLEGQVGAGFGCGVYSSYSEFSVVALVQR